jgi:pantoate--beta-alanine ligase
MLIFKLIKEVKIHLNSFKKQGKTVGFAPTMGALHAGHVSLIKACKTDNDVSICSIFINPTQFNEKKDFVNYPMTIEADILKLEKAGCDILFMPTVKEMYPTGLKNSAKINFGFLAETLEGEFRPGHFDGMIQIVEKLLKVVEPGKLYMGQKDYQQQLLVRELIKKRKLNTKLVMCPTAREEDGLAMSSRNVRLDKPSRKLAVELSKTLKGVKAAIHQPKSNISQVREWGASRLAGKKGIETEYFEIRNAETLKPPKSKKEKLVALVAANIGGVRLIDNMLLN